AKAIEQPRLAPGVVVARRRMALRYEKVLDRVAVAAGALEADHVPDVGHPGLRFGEQHRADDRAAVGVEERRLVRRDDRDMAAEPGGVVAAAGKAPGRGHPVAALDDPRLSGSRAPGEDAAGSAKDLAGR